MRKREREGGKKREIEKDGERERDKNVEYGYLIFILKGMTGASAPFNYLVI